MRMLLIKAFLVVSLRTTNQGQRASSQVGENSVGYFLVIKSQLPLRDSLARIENTVWVGQAHACDLIRAGRRRICRDFRAGPDIFALYFSGRLVFAQAFERG